MLRVILGLVKGLIVGGAVGYGLMRLGVDGSVMAYAACALVGALVGVIAGRPPWRAETIWTPVVKALFGGLVGAALCFVGRRFLPEMSLPAIAGVVDALPMQGASVLATAVGVLYGIFVEVDDGGSADAEKKSEAPKSLPAKK